MRRTILLLISFSFMSCLMVSPLRPVYAAVQAPVLKWQHGGCYSSWCETGWYSSPAVADLDHDGTQEVIAAAYSIFILNGADGTEKRTIDPEGGRVWPGVVVADLDGIGGLEIVTAHGGGYLHVFDPNGESVWSRRPSTSELRGLSVNDLDHDGTLEIVVNAAVGSKVNTWIYEHDGTLRNGWPQLDNTSGYAYGVFNDNASIGDLNGNGLCEIVVPSDVHYICAYDSSGVQLPAHAMYGDKAWGAVGVWESLAIELRGWGACDGVREESYRANFAHGASVIADLNGDGHKEVVVTGNVYDCQSGYESKYTGIYIFNADRSRFDMGGYNWEIPPVDTGAPLSEDYNLIENCQPNPVMADLDGDGTQEIIFPSYDGRMHAFWLDKTEHGNWPYSIYNPAEGFFRFASEPVVADLDHDGQAEIIFASWVQKGTNRTGRLHILNSQGTSLHETDLPPAFGSPTWNGGLAAPTLANIDVDADLEVIVNTAHSGVVAYDLPGTANARVLWGTGRGKYYRNGSSVFAEEVIVKMALDSGWSMISLPVNPDDSKIKLLFPDAQAVFQFTNKYELLDPNDDMVAGRGYWIYLPEAHTYTLTGAPIEGYSIEDAPAGWSMIGGCSSPSHPSVQAGEIRAVFGFSNKYRLLDPNDALETGKGYWINISEQSDMTVQSAYLLSMTIDPNAIILTQIGGTQPLTVTGYYSDGSIIDLTEDLNTVYVSSDPNIATVGNDGIVTAVAEGQATISATNRGIISQTKVMVQVPQIQGLWVGTWKAYQLDPETGNIETDPNTGEELFENEGEILFRVTEQNIKPLKDPPDMSIEGTLEILNWDVPDFPEWDGEDAQVTLYGWIDIDNQWLKANYYYYEGEEILINLKAMYTWEFTDLSITNTEASGHFKINGTGGYYVIGEFDAVFSDF